MELRIIRLMKGNEVELRLESGRMRAKNRQEDEGKCKEAKQDGEKKREREKIGEEKKEMSLLFAIKSNLKSIDGTS